MHDSAIGPTAPDPPTHQHHHHHHPRVFVLRAGSRQGDSVTLNGPAPWGFRLQGGKDFNMPLTISR
ncbi:hypothetical protein INR49_005713, partial [Caranx melampygus]